MKYATVMGSVALVHKIGSGIQTLMEGGFTDSRTGWISHKLTLGK
jgi:hypothetical protein